MMMTGEKLEIAFDDKEIAKLNAIHAHASKDKAMDMGLIGRVFGSATEKPGNIAGLTMTVLLLLLAAILVFGTDTPSISKKDELALVGGFVSLTLGFIFGRSTS
ncbi:hypothetical protein AB8Z38_27765 [Bradyrhizobium sp. LLZ17]|uniref:Uncharacterized protein n=1 Tax=Bradyrhizobium sp. LLZ17 TaxID=3239388 RepID=A0AB39XGU7_9BRAD